jgi:aryl-alcohol dehydrogenase-like predicted oxidoreductase
LSDNDLRRNMPRFNSENWPRNLALVEAFNAIASEYEITAAQLALGWVHAQGDHIVSIPGTASIQHLEENIARWDWVPPAELIDRLNALINQNTVAGSRYGAVMQKTIDTEEF